MKALLFNSLINEFYKNGKYKFYLLFLLSIVAGLFEYMGLILIFQFVLFLSNPTTKHCREIINFFETNLNITDFSKIALILGISIAFIYILKNIYMLIFTRINNSILQDLSVKMTLKTVKNILFQDYLEVSKTKNEDMIAIISKNEFIVWQYCYKFINLVSNLTMAMILVAYLFIKFTLSATIAVVFISILSFVEYRFLKKNSSHQNECFSSCFDKLNSILIKTINSIKEIKLNNKQEYFIEKIEKNAKEYAILNKDRSFCSIFHIYFTEISVMFTFILVLGALFYTTNFDNQLLITSISTICVIILRLTPLINRAQSCLYAINANRNLVVELLAFNKKFQKDIEYFCEKSILPFCESIELKKINFSYNKEKSGLKNINLKIKKGEFVGIVGKSGCYKTTLSLILSGLIKPDNGEIFIDNSLLKQEDYQKWQNNIALLSQDYSILFDDFSNIKKSCIEKLDLNINDKICEMSYGQKHRIALANILSQDKNILILDEISSSCDVLSEEKINNILLELKGKKTIISIAHRLQILKHCDRIIYMDNGEIIDIDTFKNLSEKYEEFKKIVELSDFKIN